MLPRLGLDAGAQQLELQYFIFTLNINGTITITGCTGPVGDVTIRDAIDGVPVTGIANSAPYRNSNLFSNLASVSMGNSVTSIGDYAFDFCTRLANVTIGKRVSSIGGHAFSYCTRLAAVYFRGAAPSFGGDVFYTATPTVRC